MTLSTQAALSKDQRTANARPTMEHRHFSAIASIIAGLPSEVRNLVAIQFALELSYSNARFDRERFLKAAGFKDKKET